MVMRDTTSNPWGGARHSCALSIVLAGVKTPSNQSTHALSDELSNNPVQLCIAPSRAGDIRFMNLRILQIAQIHTGGLFIPVAYKALCSRQRRV